MERWTLQRLEDFGRVRLSRHFFMRQMLHSEIAQINGFLNAPGDPDLAVYAGKQLCENILEPITSAWGPIIIRSAYRSEQVNDWGNRNKANCASNDKNYAAHIWDKRDARGNAGATACVVIPAYLDYYERSKDWASLAWWLHHNLPGYLELCFFPNQCAFNVRWYEDALAPKTIRSYVNNPHTGDKSALVKNGAIHAAYAEMPAEQRFSACSTLLNQLRSH